MEVIGRVQHSTSAAVCVINHRVKNAGGAGRPRGGERAAGRQGPRAAMTPRVSIRR